jgi:fermentation-respiration switch protein FrsA (DUF1100 family)
MTTWDEVVSRGEVGAVLTLVLLASSIGAAGCSTKEGGSDAGGELADASTTVDSSAAADSSTTDSDTTIDARSMADTTSADSEPADASASLDSSSTGDAPPLSALTACQTLTNLTIASSDIGLPTTGARVQLATLVISGAGEGEYCAVKGVVKPVDANAPSMQFQVNLPTSWNNKAVQFGGGGDDGILVTGLGPAGLQPSTVASPLGQGYVTLGSDGGHQGVFPFDSTFALNDEALQNFGKQSVKKTHDVAVAIVKARYGRPPTRFYFIGNSQGGHEALDGAARYPGDYDGVVSNFPAYNVAMINLGVINIAKGLYGNGGSGWLNPAKTKLIADAVYAACDGLDGSADGLVSNVAGCNAVFNVATVRSNLRCAGGIDTGNTCLSDAQIATVDRIASPFRPGFPVAGMDELPRVPLLEGATFQVATFGTRAVPANPPTPLDSLTYGGGAGFIKFFITRDPSYDALTFDPAAWQPRVVEVGGIIDVTDVDLTPFRTKGGKILMVHGTVDEFITPHNSTAYYNRHLAIQGQQAMDTFFRFYLIPGLSHGFGPFNAKYDGLAIVDNWVNTGTPPGPLTVVDENGGTNARTRPMCQYPTWPKFTGADGGSKDDAANYTCVTQ